MDKDRKITDNDAVAISVVVYIVLRIWEWILTPYVMHFLYP